MREILFVWSSNVKTGWSVMFMSTVAAVVAAIAVGTGVVGER